MKREIIKACCFVTVVMLCGCGGGGGDNSNGLPSDDGIGSGTSVLTGKLVEPQISGLRYSTETQSGYTTSDSEFSYQSGEKIQFYIGDTEIGELVEVNQELAFGALFPNVGSFPGFNELKTLYAARPETEERKNFNQFHNSLALLVAFDSDSDFSTGIDLASGLNDILSGVGFDVRADIYQFTIADSAFTFYRNKAFSEGLTGTAAYLAVGMVMDTYYSSIGNSPGFSLPIYEEADFNGDGIPETAAKYVYDGKGNLVEDAYSSTGAAPFDTKVVTYNEYGRVLTYSRDEDGDGVDDLYQESEYNAAGDYSTIWTDSDADGMFDVIRNFTYEYKSDSYSTERKLDYDGDGIDDEVFRFEFIFGERGLLQAVLYNDVNYQTLEYRADGTLSALHYYVLRTGELDQTKTFDQAGRVVVDESFGASPSRREYIYDAQGILLQSSYQTEASFGSYLDSYEYSATGKLIFWGRDFYSDGTLELKREYLYDSDDRLFQEDWYEVTQGGQVTDWPSSRILYTYNERGLVGEKVSEDLTYDVPDDPNGGKNRTIFQYDSDENLILLGQDSGADGQLDSEIKYELEVAGWRAALDRINSSHTYAQQPFEAKPYTN
ncbi:hypothetical protein [Microbulbifer sp. ALW1]|uniref:hypothetical protein n=1 Tax=Microbulbifer sp. (strain ALW1) TaxID=1516059 RepID=UPI00135AD797|nr:hypothetical protein [Microbulbifer sp. ALW1]